MVVSPQSPYIHSAPGGEGGAETAKPESAKIIASAKRAQKLLSPYFMPFLVKINRESHAYPFFPRRWFESKQLMGVLQGFAAYQSRTDGLRKHTDEQRAYIYTLSLCFEWPAQNIAAYLNDVGFETQAPFRDGMTLAKNVLSERGQRKKLHELSLIRLIDDEHYGIAENLKKTLTNPTLKLTFNPRDFQVAKGW